MHRYLPAVAALALLAGCSSTDQGLALVDTKAQVQLLRNGTAERIPADAIASVENTTDHSTECDDGDPWRQWASSVVVGLTPEAAPTVRELYAGILDSYVDEGWVSSRPGQNYTALVNTGAFSKIVVTITDEDAAAGLLVEVTGPCVLTDGAGSDEVDALEQ